MVVEFRIKWDLIPHEVRTRFVSYTINMFEESDNLIRFRYELAKFKATYESATNTAIFESEHHYMMFLLAWY